MPDSQQKPTGTRYTATVMFLTIALVFTPAALLFSHPFGYVSISIATVCTLICLTLARVSWTKYSQVSIPSISINSRHP